VEIHLLQQGARTKISTAKRSEPSKSCIYIDIYTYKRARVLGPGRMPVAVLLRGAPPLGHPGRHMGHPGSPMSGTGASKTLRERLKRDKECPKSGHVCAKSDQDRPNRSQDRPNKRPERPRAPQERPKSGHKCPERPLGSSLEWPESMFFLGFADVL